MFQTLVDSYLGYVSNVTVDPASRLIEMFIFLQERYQKFSSNPPIRSKRKAERLKEEEAKRIKLMQQQQQDNSAANNNNNKEGGHSDAAAVAAGGGGTNGIEGSSPEGGDKSNTPSSDSPKVKEHNYSGYFDWCCCSLIE